MKKIFNLIILSIIAFTVQAQHVTIEAPSPDPTLVVRGPEKAINMINDSGWEKQDNCITLFSGGYGKSVVSTRNNYVAIQVDKQMRVSKILNGATTKGKIPSFNRSLNLDILTDGFNLVASDNSYEADGFKRFVAENFKLGDIVKLRYDGEVISLEDLLKKTETKAAASLVINGDVIRTVIGEKESISGFIENFDKNKKFKIIVKSANKEVQLKCDKKGNFAGSISLLSGTNYVDVKLFVNEVDLQTLSMAIYSKEKNQTKSDVVLWVEQFPNATKLINDQAVEDMIKNAKTAGFTSVGFDVKGPEGYVSYRKNELSKTPYLTHSINPKKKVKDTGFDLLQSILTISHKFGLKVYVSFNFFTEGNITAQDYAILDQHKDWEEIVQRPEDMGKLMSVRESQHGRDAAAGKKIALAFINPSNKEAQDFQLLRVEEVLRNYAVDGIILDRCRYDNVYADFSHTTRNAFVDYLQSEGKNLENFPSDAFIIDATGNMKKGKYYNEWITFRSFVIKNFADRVRCLVDQYKASTNPNLKLAAYVGSWYEVYYQNGVNWASCDFKYNSALKFPESSIYTDKYSQTSYLKNLDFLMIGTYYKTAKEVNRYITLGNILTNGALPIIGSMSLPDLKPEEQTDVFKASLNNSSGLMIFDNCYIKWQEFIGNLQAAFKK